MSAYLDNLNRLSCEEARQLLIGTIERMQREANRHLDNFHLSKSTEDLSLHACLMAQLSHFTVSLHHLTRVLNPSEE